MISDSLCGYGRIHDPVVLRIAVQELARIREWLGQAADIAAESPQLSVDHVLGIHAATEVILHLHRLAATRLAVVTARQRPAAVTVVDPGPLELGWSSPVSEAPVVGVPAVAAAGLSSSVVSLSPGHASVPRSYPDDTIVMGLIGTIQVIWWDATGAKHQLDSPRRHHTHVRRGTRHCLYNAGLLPAHAVQSRANSDMTADVDWAHDVGTDPAAGHRTAEQAVDRTPDSTATDAQQGGSDPAGDDSDDLDRGRGEPDTAVLDGAAVDAAGPVGTGPPPVSGPEPPPYATPG